MSGSDRPAALDAVRKLVALSLFNDSDGESHSANDKARALLKKHRIGLEELLGGRAASDAWGPADMMRFVSQVHDGGADLFARAQAFVSHPDTQKAIEVGKNLWDLGKRGVEALQKRKAAR